eukprot:TRINITY_DN2565_c0_g2_i1.p1 TRINITY_DN2565_c0_g2~~TRINITY_DN2565_c0_g2_i1.p1  ORF type:complete len:315 (+),score=51.74 TRINITY_DN2565_c0_g2_i1:796-1740(+)
MVEAVNNGEIKVALSSVSNLTSWLINLNELDIGDLLDYGHRWRVFKGKFKGHEVSIKNLPSLTSFRQLNEIKKEFHILCSTRSPYVLNFFGASFEERLSLIFEYCSRGTLFQVLHDKNQHIGWEKFFKFTKNIALGLSFLHKCSPPILHRNFISLNILVNEDWDCKVTGFNLSRFNTVENAETLAKLRGAFSHCAPELVNGTSYTVQSDIYSMGIIIYEIVTRIMNGKYMRPYSEYKHVELDFQIVLSAANGLRPTLPENTPQVIAGLYRTCVSAEPSDRLDCNNILETLKVAEEMYNNDKLGWDSLIGHTNHH